MHPLAKVANELLSLTHTHTHTHTHTIQTDKVDKSNSEPDDSSWDHPDQLVHTSLHVPTCTGASTPRFLHCECVSVRVCVSEGVSVMQVRTWLLPIGGSLSLCTITVKMWRVFVIYRITKRLQSLKEKKVYYTKNTELHYYV